MSIIIFKVNRDQRGLRIDLNGIIGVPDAYSYPRMMLNRPSLIVKITPAFYKNELKNGGFLF